MNSERHLFLLVLNKHAPTKSKILRAYHASYMGKKLRKAVMRRSLLEIRYFKTRTTNYFKAYEKYKIFCSKSCKMEIIFFFRDLNLALVTNESVETIIYRKRAVWEVIMLFFKKAISLLIMIRKNLVNGVPSVSTCPTCTTCPCVLRALLAHMPKYILQTGKLKISILMKSDEDSFTDVFKGAEF